MNTSETPGMLSWRVIVPFMLTGTIWGSTWFVITGQIDGVPAAWSVFYRFALATPGMFLLALVMKRSLKLDGPGHMLAVVVGVLQFCGNFMFVYHSELHLTSGIVAVFFALLMVPNAIFARIFIGERMQAGFMLGSAVAIAGVAMLLVHEARTSTLGGDVLLGVALCLGGLLSASVANVVQANEVGRRIAMVSLLAWAMLYGLVADLIFALVTVGPPPLPTGAMYWMGTAYLALIGSIVTFPLHYNLVREIGAGRTAYNAIVTVVVAMLLSTLFEDYRWTPLAMAGMALALGGMVLALRSRRTRSVKVGQATTMRPEPE
ncbi:DMT family transporter [Alteraurantiacibacter aquimixticola]|uniref:EamA family transporter n=1 Tax=Alteraurantiacibacter aquimixticola TaxID=2489173 RepID=A0A4T3EYQ8_9SPHN|nr:EamA family transporter [Alteraurantiacibacter aquimixticola]TIX49221.1 EamA family transporter [Alteraurantiacibacter aquimixticola]